MSQPEESGLERDYCAGQLSLRDLADIYGISEGAIRKRAKKHGWVRSVKTGTQKGTQVRKSGKHKTRSQLEALENTLREATEKQIEAGGHGNAPMVAFVTEIAESWALPDEFNCENVLVLLENYPRAFDSIAMTYTRELMALREKN